MELDSRRIDIDLGFIQEKLALTIFARRLKTLFDSKDAVENNEARYQLVEGCFYDYEFNDERFSLASGYDQIVQPHSGKRHLGTLAPNIYVGTLTLDILCDNEQSGEVSVEVQSVKSGYRDDYRDMLELITEKSTDLLLQANSPVSHYFEIDYTRDNRSLYQRFAFIKSIITSEEFTESVHRIVTSPVTRWAEVNEYKDVRQARRFSGTGLKELVKGSNRSHLPETHHLRSYGIETFPTRITSIRKTDSLDTPENRFVKHALEVFLKFCTDINEASTAGSRLYAESAQVIKQLESELHHTFFKEISRPTTLKLNSPVLQRKEGYREILRVWLMFDLAAKLIWRGGEDVYSGGKKDIATLYEYWLFFVLLDLFENLFGIKPKDIEELIKETSDGLNLQIKQGQHIPLSGVYNSGNRKLRVRFSYNRSFGGKKTYPDSGSWTTTMRPDYTLSVWPDGLEEEDAEKEELIVHIHFDAKYKIANLPDLLESDSETPLDDEKVENRKGIYKNADLLKMHAYKDAIRRTGGAYVLYPGEKRARQKGFHEIVPGLGAFPVQPSKTKNGVAELREFILEVLDHFENRASQRERVSLKSYQVYKDKPPEKLDHFLPEAYGKNRSMIPDETYVLVAYYKSQEHLEWILKTGLYNTRTESKRGSLRLGPGESGAVYVLLHSDGEATAASKLLKVIEIGPKVFSQQSLVDKGYPTEPTQDFYLVYKVELAEEPELKGNVWNLTKLEGFKTGRGSALPFAVSLSELMRDALVRNN